MKPFGLCNDDLNARLASDGLKLVNPDFESPVICDPVDPQNGVGRMDEGGGSIPDPHAPYRPHSVACYVSACVADSL